MRKTMTSMLLPLSLSALMLSGCGRSESPAPPAPPASEAPAAPSSMGGAPAAPAAEAKKVAAPAAGETKAAIAAEATKATESGEAAATELSTDQKAFIESAKSKLADLKAQAEKLLADARQNASPETAKALDTLESALKNAESTFADLQSAGAKAWADKKPLLEAALKDLLAKFGQAKAQTVMGAVKMPDLSK